MQKTDYQIIDKNDNKKLAQFLCQEGQLLLPMVELIKLLNPLIPNPPKQDI